MEKEKLRENQTHSCCHKEHEQDMNQTHSCCEHEHKKEHSCCESEHKNEVKHSCCSSKSKKGPCGCGIDHKIEGKNQMRNMIIKLSISLVLLVLGFFDWHHIGFDTFYYFNPAWVTVLICGIPIFVGAFNSLKNKKITASVLISVAMLASIALELTGFFYEIGGEHSHSYIFAAGEVAFLMAIGGAIEEITIKKTRSGIERLVNLIPKEAFVKTPAGLVKTPLENIKIGDIVIAKAGENIAVDGIILSGNSMIDQSSVTGEYLPVEVQEGATVFGGTLNLSGVIEIKVTKRVNDMTISKMAQLVEEASGKKAPISRIADKWASVIVPLAILSSIAIGLITGFAFSIPTVDAIVRAITVLVVFCPCSLALATPTAITAGVGNSARNGVLIKSGESLENMSRVTTVCFDKTGTLTTGEIVLSDISVAKEFDENEVLNLVASVESYSEHPIAKAVLNANKLKIVKPENMKVLQGIGAFANVQGKEVLVCSFKHAVERGFKTDEFKDFCDKMFSQGKTLVAIVIDNELSAMFAFSDTIRPNAKTVILDLNRKGYKTVMLTGDNENSAKFIAEACGISEIKHSLLPEQKLEAIKAMQENGEKVLMIGDGINDAPSLKIADCSIAMGALGSDIAIETADMSILNSDLEKVDETLGLSKRTLRTIKRNIILSMAINVFAVVASGFGWLTPVTGALVHNCTSVLVVLSSALLLRRKKKNDKN